MQRKDAIVSVLWMLVGLIICIWSSTFPFGAADSPGPAYLPFGCGLIFILLGGILFFANLPEALKQRAIAQPLQQPRDREGAKRVILTLGGMLLGAACLETLGFALTIFLLMLSLTQVIHRQKWRVALAFALLSSIGSVILFQIILKTELPSGFMKF